MNKSSNVKKFKVGDIIEHKESDSLLQIVEILWPYDEKGNKDEKRSCLITCSPMKKVYNYLETDLLKVEEDDERLIDILGR